MVSPAGARAIRLAKSVADRARARAAGPAM